MRKCVLFLFVLYFICFSQIYGQKTNYQTFRNINMESGASVITCLLQDDQGLIWIGTNKGLFSYDGYNAQPHFSLGERNNTQVHCGVIFDNSRLCLGSDKGILVYNLRTDRYEEPVTDIPTDVRTLVLQNRSLWIGTLNGLYRFDLESGTLKQFDHQHYRGLPHQTIYSIIRTHDDGIYIGTYDGFCRYMPEKDDFQRIILPVNLHKNNQFINSLLEDTTRKCIWIGTEGSLLKYSLIDHQAQQIETFHDNSIKSLALDGNSHLLIGTDNGLYVYHESEAPMHILHDSRNLQSLSNNIIWSIFADHDQNIWFGTDYGISLSRCNNILQYITISQITGNGEGNQFYSIFRDSRNNYWLGGTNGIIQVNQIMDRQPEVTWYKMGNKSHPLPHNRIRHIFEDMDSELWIASDGNLNRYDYNKRQFVQYNILDSTGTFNTNWAYNLFEDDEGNLWIATCLGGIFMVDKQKLLHSEGNYIADYNYTTRNGLSGKFINQIIPDHEGNVWVLLYNNGIDKINRHTREVTRFPLGELTGKMNPNYILCDQDGIVWVGFRGGVMLINPANNQIRKIKLDTFSNNDVLAMMEAGEVIWISTTDGIWLVDKKSLETHRLNLSDKRFISMYFDKTENRIFLGGVDGFAVVSADVQKNDIINKPVIATALYVNNQPVRIDTSIRYAGTMELNYKQNNFSVELSDLPYSLEEKNKFVYKLDGFDDRWNMLPPNTNRIAYVKLNPGNFTLFVSKLDASGKPADNPYTLDIRITPPWYYTTWAKSIYILMILSLVVWTINFFRVKHRLRQERIEKERILEQSRMKVEFFTNLSHDLKTPLSMIIAPISKLIPEIKNQHEKQQLKMVHRNAMNLNSLIHQMLDFNRMDNDSNTLLILSKIEFVSFARNLFAVYEEAEKEKNYSFQFITNREMIFLELDVVKWESILNNLLSNALKYTPEGGIITLTLNYNEENRQIGISVSDTGTGIPSQDIPYIFQRFFQSSKIAGKKEGTGIGLYLVKTYAELHGGMVRIDSQENMGTTITIVLPLPNEKDGTEIPVADKDQTVNGQTADSDQPLVLIVDDNPEVTAIITDILHSRYRCCIAGNGKTGMDLCFELQPDLIISDIMMPGMDGLEMCHQIRKYVPTSAIPIILLTAKDDKETELESIQLNIDAFIPKPFEPDILLSRAEQLINRNRTLESKIRMETLATPKAIEAESHDERFLSVITKIIEDGLSDSEMNVTALCKISGINNKQIYRKIKQLTGMTPVEYIKSIRMKKAAMLLKQKKFSVAEVMYMVGFSNHSYFSKCFKEEFDKTPWQFMENPGS